MESASHGIYLFSVNFGILLLLILTIIAFLNIREDPPREGLIHPRDPHFVRGESLTLYSLVTTSFLLLLAVPMGIRAHREEVSKRYWFIHLIAVLILAALTTFLITGALFIVFDSNLRHLLSDGTIIVYVITIALAFFVTVMTAVYGYRFLRKEVREKKVSPPTAPPPPSAPPASTPLQKARENLQEWKQDQDWGYTNFPVHQQTTQTEQEQKQ